jgi:hypothetical protein
LRSPLFEPARVLARFNQVASVIDSRAAFSLGKLAEMS